MGVLILHSHLHPGGVTRVIENQVRALGPHNCRVLVGSSDMQRIAGAPVEVLPALDYLRDDLCDDQYRALYDVLKKAIKTSLSEGDILHPHNINLGKNPVLTLVVSDLAREGVFLFNHCHDFAEDNRPQNVVFLKTIIEGCFKRELASVLYPNLATTAYAVLNKRDYRFLHDQGIAEKSIQFLPNCLAAAEINPPRDKQTCMSLLGLDLKKETILYPVRVIQRKNIGEFILLASLYTDYNWCVSLAPRNPIELERYNDWKLFCTQHAISICFDVGESLAFSEVMNVADRIITTSIQEGFGMAFLEPWTYDKPLCGRNIAEITVDFTEQGLDLHTSYDSLDYAGADFSSYSVETQKELILNACSDTVQSGKIKKQFSLPALDSNELISQIKHNKEVVIKHYSLTAYAATLKENYENIAC